MVSKWFSMDKKANQRILSLQSPEQKLDSLENASRNILELHPEYGQRYLHSSFKRKREYDAQRISYTACRKRH